MVTKVGNKYELYASWDYKWDFNYPYQSLFKILTNKSLKKTIAWLVYRN